MSGQSPQSESETPVVAIAEGKIHVTVPTRSDLQWSLVRPIADSDPRNGGRRISCGPNSLLPRRDAGVAYAWSDDNSDSMIQCLRNGEVPAARIETVKRPFVRPSIG